jgi:hypothetical protein
MWNPRKRRGKIGQKKIQITKGWKLATVGKKHHLQILPDLNRLNTKKTTPRYSSDY